LGEKGHRQEEKGSTVLAKEVRIRVKRGGGKNKDYLGRRKAMMTVKKKGGGSTASLGEEERGDSLMCVRGEVSVLGWGGGGRITESA